MPYIPTDLVSVGKLLLLEYISVATYVIVSSCDFHMHELLYIV